MYWRIYKKAERSWVSKSWSYLLFQRCLNVIKGWLREDSSWLLSLPHANDQITSSSCLEASCRSTSLWVKTKLLTVAHKAPHDLPITSLLSHPTTLSLTHLSRALLSPLEFLKDARHCLTSGPFTGPYFVPNALPLDTHMALSLPSLTSAPMSSHERGLPWLLCLKEHFLLFIAIPRTCFYFFHIFVTNYIHLV